MPQAVVALSERSEDGRIDVACSDLAPQDIGVRAIRVIALRADLYLVTVQVIVRVDHQCSGSRSDVHHHALLEAPLLVVLCHRSELTQRRLRAQAPERS